MKITKRQLVRIIREMNSSPGVHFDITKDIALQSDGLGTTDTITRDDFYDMISDYYKEQEGIRFRNFEMLDKMNIQQVAEFYDDMFPQSALRESQDPSLLPSALEAINNGTASATMGMGLGRDEILISFGQGQSVVLKLRSF